MNTGDESLGPSQQQSWLGRSSGVLPGVAVPRWVQSAGEVWRWLSDAEEHTAGLGERRRHPGGGAVGVSPPRLHSSDLLWLRESGLSFSRVHLQRGNSNDIQRY